MRILFVCGGGVIYGKETTTLSTMEGLRARGHEIRCITSTWGDAFAKRLDALSIPYTRAPLGFISKRLRWDTLYMTFAQLLRLPELWRVYRRTVKEFNPDFIIHSNFHHILLLWPLLDPKKTLFRVHDYFEPKPLYRLVIQFLNLRLRAFIGVSNFIRNSILQLGIPDVKVFSVLNGISIDGRNHKQTPSQPVTVGMVGQIGEWKGHSDLLEALKILKSSGVSFDCIIFGEGEPKYVDVLKQQIYQYGLEKSIRWMGYVEDKRIIFSKIDLCVIPSRCHESFGMVAAEATSFGVPVIAAKTGGLPEIILEGETGYLIDPASPHEIAEKLRLLIENPDLRQRMGDTARTHAARSLSRERMVQEMETLLFNMMSVGMSHV